MKYVVTVFILLLLLLITSCMENNVIGPLVTQTSFRYIPSNEAREHYLLKATEFAVEYLIATKSPDTNSIIVPEIILNKFLYPLAFLYDSCKSIPLLDTLIIQKHIRKQINHCYGSAIKVDTSYLWAKNIKNDILPTGNIIVDSLVKLYSLEFDRDIWWGFQGYAWIFIRHKPLNVWALGNAFRKVPGVFNTEPNTAISFFSDLDVIPSSTQTTVRFYAGYGDCFAGCFGYERWTFTVSRDYKIKYEGYLLQ